MEFDDFTDIIRFAMDNELEAQTFYEEAAMKEYTALADVCRDEKQKKLFLDRGRLRKGAGSPVCRGQMA